MLESYNLEYQKTSKNWS